MTIDKPTSQVTESIKQWATSEDIQKSKLDTLNSQKLTQVNNVLKILDFPDNLEDRFRNILQDQSSEVLFDLSTKSKIEIQWFLLNLINRNKKEEKINQKDEKQTQSQENQKIEQKISKIRSILTPDILDKNPDIKEKLEAFDSFDNPSDKDKAIKDILEILKQPWKLKSIIDSLGWADKNNPKYLEFKNSLIWLDSSFESYFNELENLEINTGLNTNEIIKEIENESWWVLNIDLNSNQPLSKLSLTWSKYSFDEEIDKQALNELNTTSNNKIEETQNSFAILKGLYNPFDSLLSQIRTNWQKLDFKENLKQATSNFSREIFADLWDVYKNMNIKSDIQINESDINSFKDVKTPEELKTKIDDFKTKLVQIQNHIKDIQTWILKDYKTELKELVKRKEEAKEKQLETLEFMKASWFDLIPKDITNRIIAQIESNTLTIPWLELNRSNIDLKNGNFGESWAFVNKEWWINIEAKRNMVKFMNKLISWNINEPSSVEAIVNWTSVSNDSFMKNKFIEAWIIDWMSWKYGRIVENIKKII